MDELATLKAEYERVYRRKTGSMVARNSKLGKLQARIDELEGPNPATRNRLTPEQVARRSQVNRTPTGGNAETAPRQSKEAEQKAAAMRRSYERADEIAQQHQGRVTSASNTVSRVEFPSSIRAGGFFDEMFSRGLKVDFADSAKTIVLVKKPQGKA